MFVPSKMTLSEFNLLDNGAKGEIVWQWGYFITNYFNGDHTVALFYTFDFFAEVHISPSDNKTLFVNGLAEEQLNEDFLSKIYSDPLAGMHPIKKYLKNKVA